MPENFYVNTVGAVSSTKISEAAKLIECAIRGLPANDMIFLPGNPLLPPLAGMMHTTLLIATPLIV